MGLAGSWNCHWPYSSFDPCGPFLCLQMVEAETPDGGPLQPQQVGDHFQTEPEKQCLCDTFASTGTVDLIK